MACYGGVILQIFWSKFGSIYVLFISLLFSKMANGGAFGVWNCKYSLPIPNPNTLY